MPGVSNPDWESYEELTQDLMARVGPADGVSTIRRDRSVTLAGHAAENRIDVLWECRDQSDRLIRLVFECRSYKRRITQQALHSCRSVVDDVSEPGVETVGVMVTTTGYQAGARRVADTYGIVICEPRAPNEADLAGRYHTVRVPFVARLPQVTDLEVKATEQLGPNVHFNGPLGEFFLDLNDGTTEALGDHLLRGELASLEEPPTASHGVTRSFPSPVLLRRLAEPIARVCEISAMVSEVESEPTRIETGMERGAWMLANTLTRSHVWFTQDGRIWQSPS
jgi:hypothetical protein